MQAASPGCRRRPHSTIAGHPYADNFGSYVLSEPPIRASRVGGSSWASSSGSGTSDSSARVFLGGPRGTILAGRGSHEMNMGLQADVGWALVALTMMMACGGSVANVAGKRRGRRRRGRGGLGRRCRRRSRAGRDLGPGVDSGSGGVDSGPAQNSGPVISSGRRAARRSLPADPPMQATMCSVSPPPISSAEVRGRPVPRLQHAVPVRSERLVAGHRNERGVLAHHGDVRCHVRRRSARTQACSAEGLWCNYPEGNCYCSELAADARGQAGSCVALAPTCPPDRLPHQNRVLRPGPERDVRLRAAALGAQRLLCADAVLGNRHPRPAQAEVRLLCLLCLVCLLCVLCLVPACARARIDGPAGGVPPAASVEGWPRCLCAPWEWTPVRPPAAHTRCRSPDCASDLHLARAAHPLGGGAARYCWAGTLGM